jgi:hypothetical protein
MLVAFEINTLGIILNLFKLNRAYNIMPSSAADKSGVYFCFAKIATL